MGIAADLAAVHSNGVSLPILEGAVEKGFAHCHQHKRGAMLSRDGSETTSRPNSAKA